MFILIAGFFISTELKAQGRWLSEVLVYQSSGVVPIFISKVRPILIKFHITHHRVGGKAA